MESATMAANIPLHTFFRRNGPPDESPTRSYQLHGVNEEAFGVNSQSYGIVYQGKKEIKVSTTAKASSTRLIFRMLSFTASINSFR